ncbi:MAG: universal stress protein [Chitinophagaceae bacterium]|nr:universal stress protein [Chitinophagaceae bacterium]
MKRILFPTDLTEKPKKALDYAQYLSINTGSELVLFHAAMDEAERAKSIQELKALTLELEQSEVRGAKTIRYDYMSQEGLPVDQLVEAMDKSKSRMLVMATTGANRDNFQGLYLKSNTSAVLEKLNKPVLFFPVDSKVDKISRALVSVDVMRYSKEIITQFYEFSKLFNAKIGFVYVDNSNKIEVQEAIERFKYFLTKEIPSAVLQVVKDAPLEEAINGIVQADHIDLLVMTKNKKTFWEKWFAKSATQSMAYSASIPVLVFSAD